MNLFAQVSPEASNPSSWGKFVESVGIPMVFALLFLAALVWLLRRQICRDEDRLILMEGRLFMLAGCWTEAAAILGKLAKPHKIDVSEETKHIEDLVKDSLYESEPQPRRPWWRRKTP